MITYALQYVWLLKFKMSLCAESKQMLELRLEHGIKGNAAE